MKFLKFVGFLRSLTDVSIDGVAFVPPTKSMISLVELILATKGVGEKALQASVFAPGKIGI